MATDHGASVLSMRVARELARGDDLAHLLSLAVPDHSDPRPRLEPSLAGYRSAIEQLTEGPDGAAGLAGLAEPVKDADALVNEVVALLLTRLLRAGGLDSGTFDTAEALLRELAERAGVPPVVLGQTQGWERHDCTHNRIDLRFPGLRVWEVPILAHEFGHHAIAHVHDRRPELADARPLREVCDSVTTRLIEAGQEDAFAEARAEELVADAIAVVCCGPAYAVTALCLRVPPARARAMPADRTHPPWRDRVAAMREVLDALTATTGRTGYSGQRETVIDPLVVMVLGEIPDASAADKEAASGAVEAVNEHRPGLLYREAEPAIDVKTALDRRDESPPGNATVAAVLDGAWRWRLKHGRREEDDATAALAVRYCRAIAKGQRHGHR